MTIHIDKVTLDNFRGYTHLSLEGLERLVIIVGPNAVGKTNIVEALQLLTCAESFRKPNWREMVSWGSESCRIRMEMTDGKRLLEHEMVIDSGQRAYLVNGKKKSAGSLRGTCPSVLFIPDDLQMVKASSARRRDTIDALGMQLSKAYGQIKSEYAKALKQRNLLLREELASGMLFESWNESLVVHGSRLYSNRFRLFKRLAAHMENIYSQLVEGEQLKAVYQPSWTRFDAQGRQLTDRMEYSELEQVEDMDLAAVQEQMSASVIALSLVERQRKTSLVGPHKDEIAFFINGKNARMFASQGQQRTIVLVEKLAEVELVREMLGQEPVLLLDDVMSELDAAHRASLTWFMEQSAQTFVTTTNLGYFSEDLIESAQVVKLPIENTRL